MAELNPGFQTKHEETYLNYSRGAQSPDALRTPQSKQVDNTLVNVGNIGVAAFDTKNRLVEDRIYNEVVADVDDIRDAWIGTSTSSGSDNPNVPADLVKQAERMRAVVEANKSGMLTEEAYWMQMENIARATRSRYPGHREYIDRVVANITGGTPANILQRAVTSRANESMSAEQKRRDWVEKEMIQKGILPQNPGDYTTNQLESWLNRQNEVDLRARRRRDALSERESEMNVDAKEVYNVAAEEVTTRVALSMKETTDKFLKAKASLVDQARTGRMDPKAYEEVQILGLQLREERRAMVEGILDQYPTMRPADRKEILDREMAAVDATTSDIASGRYNILDSQANRNKVLELEDDATLLSNQHARSHASIRRTLGENVLNSILTADAQALQGYSRLVHEVFKQAQIDPESSIPSMATKAKETLDNPKLSDSERSANINADLNGSVLMLTNRELPPATRARVATSVFGVGEENVLRFIDDDVQYFQSLNGPEVARSMIELRDAGHTQVYNDYLKWRDLSFKYIYSTELDSARSIVVDRASMNLTRTPNGGLAIEYIPRRGIGAFSPSPLDNAWEGVASWFSAAESAVSTINGAIDAMRPTWALEGKDANQEIDKLLIMSGVDLSAPKTPMGPSTLAAAIGNFLMDPVRGMASDVTTFLKAEQGQLNRNEQMRNDDIGRLSDDPFLQDLSGVIEFARSRGYTPGSRVSTNIEDRTSESMGLLRAGENFQPPASNDLDGLDGNSIEDSLRAIFGDRAPMMLSNWDTLSPTTQQEIMAMYPGQSPEAGGSPGSRDHSLLPPSPPDNNYAINDASYGARAATESVRTQQEADHWADYLQFRITNNARYIKAIEESDTMTDPSRKKEIIRLSKERQKVFEEAYKEFKKNLPKDLPDETSIPDTPMN